MSESSEGSESSGAWNKDVEHDMEGNLCRNCGDRMRVLEGVGGRRRGIEGESAIFYAEEHILEYCKLEVGVLLLRPCSEVSFRS